MHKAHALQFATLLQPLEGQILIGFFGIKLSQKNNQWNFAGLLGSKSKNLQSITYQEKSPKYDLSCAHEMILSLL